MFHVKQSVGLGLAGVTKHGDDEHPSLFHVKHRGHRAEVSQLVGMYIARFVDPYLPAAPANHGRNRQGCTTDNSAIGRWEFQSSSSFVLRSTPTTKSGFSMSTTRTPVAVRD